MSTRLFLSCLLLQEFAFLLAEEAVMYLYPLAATSEQEYADSTKGARRLEETAVQPRSAYSGPALRLLSLPRPLPAIHLSAEMPAIAGQAKA